MDAVRAADLRLAVDPPGGTAEEYWETINAEYRSKVPVGFKWFVRDLFNGPAVSGARRALAQAFSGMTEPSGRPKKWA